MQALGAHDLVKAHDLAREKLAVMRVLVKLSPIGSVVDNFAVLEAKGVTRLFRLLNATDAGIAIRDRARKMCEGLHHDRGLVAGLDTAMGASERVKQLIHTGTCTVDAMKKELPNALESCTNLHCAYKCERKEFKLQFRASVESTIVDFANSWWTWNSKTSKSLFSTVIAVMEDLVKLPIKELRAKHTSSLLELNVGTSVLVTIHAHQAVKSVKALSLSLKSCAPDWAEEDAAQASFNI